MSESQPLLSADGNGQQNPSAPPAYDNHGMPPDLTTSVPVDESPPAYSEVFPSAIITQINCKVCQGVINLDGRQHLHVVKCAVCNEATPIKCAPPGKKYVRCPCNCLLICSVTATRVACPRSNCGRTISVGGPVAVRRSVVSTVRAACAHCNQTIVFPRASARNKLAICPYCSRWSAIGNELVRKRVITYSLIGIIFLVCGIIVTTVTTIEAAESGGIYVVWIGAFIVSLLSFIRAAYFGCVKISPIIN